MEIQAENVGPRDVLDSSVTEEAIAAGPSEEDGWYILDENGQHMGPYNAQLLEGTCILHVCSSPSASDQTLTWSLCKRLEFRVSNLCVFLTQAMRHMGMFFQRL
jgi:hypothetical protein